MSYYRFFSISLPLSLIAVAVMGICPFSAWAAEPDSTAVRHLEQLDADIQQRQAQQNRQTVERFAAQTNNTFDKPTFSSLLLPENESPCFELKHINIVDVENPHISSRFYWAYHRAARALGLTLPRCLGSQGISVLMKTIQNDIIGQGFVTTRVVAGTQDLRSGVLTLTVIPGKIRRILIEDQGRFSKFTPLTAWSGLSLASGDVLNIRDMEQSLENFKRLPSVDAAINILPAQDDDAQIGDSDLQVQYAQGFPFRLSLGIDDSGSTSTGRWQGNMTLSWDKPFTANDLFYVSFTHRLKRPHWTGQDDRGTRGSENLSFYYSVPWKYWQLTAYYNRHQYHQEIAAAYGSTLMYEGKSANSKLTLSRLIYRDSRHKTTLSASLWTRKSYNYADHSEILIQRKRTGGWEAGVQHKAYLGAATLELGAVYRRGTGLNHALPYPEEPFGEATHRMQIIRADVAFTLPFSLDSQQFSYHTSWQGQWNRTPLALQDRFSIGGRYTVRGTDGELTLSGERGWLWRNELGWQIPHSRQQLYITVDKGVVRGVSTQYLLGRTMIGASLGLRGNLSYFNYDVFVGKALHVPQGFRSKSPVIGFQLSANF